MGGIFELMRASLRRLGLGRIAYRLYHAPIAAVRESAAAGGPLEQWRTTRGRHAMRQTAWTLPSLDANLGGDALELHVLTGRRFWEQTAFCLWSFAQQARRPIAPVVYDDGSLQTEHGALLSRIFPATRFVSRGEITARLDAHLPASRFPVLRERWLHYPNIRKLTDPHAGGHGWKLVIDSDLLFFRRPGFLIEWLAAPAHPLHAVDAETSYGYSRPLLNNLAAAPVADLVNVGLCGLRSDTLDWEKIEWWCRTLIEREGTSYYLEQALVALLVAGPPCAVAPAGDYVTLPRLPEARDCRAVMHHYVADSKSWYFRHNWRRAMGSVAAE
jgi:hypothetical protein